MTEPSPTEAITLGIAAAAIVEYAGRRLSSAKRSSLQLAPSSTTWPRWPPWPRKTKHNEYFERHFERL